MVAVKPCDAGGMHRVAGLVLGLGLAAAAACTASPSATPDPTQVVTASNHSPRVVFLAVGSNESINGEVTAGEVRWAFLAPCGGTASIAVIPKMWMDRESVRTLAVGLLVDGSFNEDLAFSMLGPGQSFGSGAIPITGLVPMWTRGDVSKLPLAVVVDPDLTVREVDPSAAPTASGQCRPQTGPTPTP